MSSDDDLFASLGGSLMKDLLADLTIDNGDEGGLMSLDELEAELAQMDSLSAMPPPTSSAAAAVVQSQGATPAVHSAAIDAWSLSFQKFSAASLEEDFLKADSQRKQQEQPPPAAPTVDLGQAIDYDVNEPARVAPPPGMMPSVAEDKTLTEGVLQQAATQLLQQVQSSPPPRIPKPSTPLTPQNSITETPSIPKPVPATPQNSVSFSPPPSIPATPPPSAAATPIVGPKPHLTEGIVALPVQPQLVMPPIMAVPVRGGPAWQSPPPQPVPVAPTHRVYNNTHPRAPSIPATELSSKYMSARDIGYVVHGILRHVQAAGASSRDSYDVQYWVRRTGSKQAEESVVNPKAAAMSSPVANTQKAQTWSKERNTLGLVTRTQVSRPRAVISTPLVAEAKTDDDDQDDRKLRAQLWKARLYFDKAYQAYTEIKQLWEISSPPPAAQLQGPLQDLLRYMGTQVSAGDYTVHDETTLALFLKLEKGVSLLSRILEEALLPPKAVHALIPHVTKLRLQVDGNTQPDQRLFAIMTRVIEKLPFAPAALIGLVDSVSAADSKQALSSPARMQCVHALLIQGSQLSSQDAAFAIQWKTTEDKFMEVLAKL